jgi:eukaryotic-like serine/threonine-protein kinase
MASTDQPVPETVGPVEGDRVGEPPAPTTLNLGQTGASSLDAVHIPGYQILGELGRGGMGVVYRAHQIGLGRTVALKMIRSAEHASAEERRRFQSEAEALARLRHPNIVHVYEVGEHNGTPFFSMEYVEGGSLDRYLNGQPLLSGEAAALVETLARAIHAAHEANIIHRDLKPANVLLQKGGSGSFSGSAGADQEAAPVVQVERSAWGRGLPKVTDFGLAKNLVGPGGTPGEAGQTRTGAVMGTPSYMAPEQAAGRGREVDQRADIYALGAILYECLSGGPPFRAATVAETLLRVLNDEPLPLRQIQPDVPLDLETVCHKCLEKTPAQRYTTAEELAEELGRFRRGEPVVARPVGRLERGWRWCRRNPWVAIWSAATAFSLILGTIIAMFLAILAWGNAQDAVRAQANAEREAEKATRAESEAKKKQLEAETQLQRARTAAYAVQLGLARDDLNRGFLERARGILSNCDPEVRHWEHNLLLRKCELRLRNESRHEGAVRSVCFSPDGERLASAGDDGTIQVRDFLTGKELLSLKGHTGWVLAVCYRPDGKRLASAGDDGTVKVWDARSGREVLTLGGHEGRVNVSAQKS